MERMKASWRSVRHEPWFYSVLLLTVTPLFPDYLSFPLIIASLWLAVKDAKRHNRRLSLGTLGLLMGGYLAYMALSLFYTTDFSGTFWSLIMWVSLFAAYLAAATVLTDRRRLRAAMLCLTAVIGVVGAVAVGQYLLRELFGLRISHGFWNRLDTLAYDLLHIPVSEVDFGDRVSGTFNNPNLLAAYLVMTIPFAIAFVLTGTRSKPKAFARIALILAAYALGFSFSRGGYLALIAVGMMLFCLFVRKKFIMTLLTAIYIVLLIPPVIGNRLMTVVPDNVQVPADAVTAESDPTLDAADGSEELIDGYADDNSVHMRFVMWKNVLNNVGEHPLFGAGLGVQTTQQTLGMAGLDYKHAHNLFLEILAEGGLISLTFFASIVLVLIQRGVRLLRRRQDGEAWLLGFAILGACAALCVHGIFDFPLLTPRLLALAMLLMGTAESAAHIYLKVPVPELSFIGPRQRLGHSPALPYLMAENNLTRTKKDS